MSIGFYPGSFNPWHQGHEDILEKALAIFDTVVVAFGINSEKELDTNFTDRNALAIKLRTKFKGRVKVIGYFGLMVESIERYERDSKAEVTAIIRGLRNGNDLQYEMNVQYWNEDLGLDIPTVYFITDRKLAHISSSALRGVNSVKNNLHPGRTISY